MVISRKEPLTIVKKEISDKEHKFICLPEEGVCREVTNEDSSQAAISDAQALELARYRPASGRAFPGPQDIEWSIDQAGKTLHSPEPALTTDDSDGPGRAGS